MKRKGFGQGSVKDRLIAYTLKSRAEYAILPAADFLGQGREGHINTPGTVGSPNWEWRMPEFEKFKKNYKNIKNDYVPLKKMDPRRVVTSGGFCVVCHFD